VYVKKINLIRIVMNYKLIYTVTLCLFVFLAPNTVFANEHKSKNYLNNHDYLRINFKISEDFDDIELKVNKFEKKDNKENDFVTAMKTFPHLKKIDRLHKEKSYSDYRDKHKKYVRMGKQLPMLENWYTIKITSDMTADVVLEIYNALVRIPQISHVELESPVVPTQVSNPTPNLESYQTYLGASPLGINAIYAWTKNGGDGSGVKIIDMEQGYNSNHEDLPTPFIRVNDSNDDDHGTAVMSIIGGLDNNIGVKGIAHGSQIGFYGWGTSTANSISNAADVLDSGDVLILEGQINRDINVGDTCNTSSQDHCVPMEWAQSNFDAIQYAYLNGIIVVEAAGNGNENLDSSIYLNRFDLSVRNSGALLIAATNASGTIIRRATSNYGTRIDLNGWGHNVSSAGLYGTTLFDGGTNRTYGDSFSGTSAASPIVAGAAASLQGYYKQTNGIALEVDTIRGLLKATGTAEPSGVEVGVRPDLKAAIDFFNGNQLLIPPVLNGSWSNCFGLNWVSWNSVVGAASYNIYVNGMLTYTHSATAYLFREVSVSALSSATIKACDTNGICSESSNAVQLKKSNVCP
jgi:serine protease